ncbi:MAG: hypothetical protein Q9195_007230 [Heterodermia aff. obscurata]
MKLKTLLFLSPYILSTTSQSFTESLAAKGLLGSHFGIPGQPNTYDYVIIGGGTSGLTIASRLAEDPSKSIAVIEAGDFYEFSNGNLSEIPAFASTFTGNDPRQKNPYLDWYQYTVPQPVSVNLEAGESPLPVFEALIGVKALNNQRFLYDSGKVIGGTSGRNDLWQIRGTRGTFDKWAEQVGDDSYRFDQILPFFKRSASFHPQAEDNANNVTIPYNSSDWDPAGGPVQVSYPAWINPVSSWLSLAFTEIGLEPLKSFMSGALLGWSWLAMELDPVTQTRSSSEAFLRKSFAKDINLILYKNTLTKRIVFAGKTATSVTVDSGGLLYNISAREEIILAAGFNDKMRSPQMLMVSGVGPRETLRRLGIDVISNLPGVGQNIDWPHIEYLILDAYFGTGSGNPAGAATSKQYVAASVGLVSTFSRGNVSINSSDTANNPVISPNWLSDPRDLDMAVAAFQRGRQLFGTKSMRPIVQGEEYPGLNCTTYAQIENVIRQSANSVYNAAGTNKMGRSSDSMAVVDSKARVFGVDRLRVVDASIFPFLPPGQPSATVYALAEKIAEDLHTAASRR